MTYDEFIQNILDARGRFIDNYDGVKERHHIVMKSCGGTNDESNLIDLIDSEHYEAHKLLALENPDCREAQMAWDMMCRSNGANGRNAFVSAEEWLEARKRWREAFSGENHPMYGKHHTDEAKRKISEGLKGVMAGENNPQYGTHKSDETKKKLSASLKGKLSGEKHPFYGKHLSEETKRKISESSVGKKRSEETKKNISNALTGHVVTEEARAKMSATKKGKYCGINNPMYGKHLSEETKRKLSEAHKRHIRENGNPRAKRCICEGVVYQSVADCANHYNVNPDAMRKWLKTGNVPDEWRDLGLSYYNM